ncbi:hypothetical protein ACQ4WX_44745 [Streptomyces lasalocidi]
MSNSATDRAAAPQTLWAVRGRHTGTAPDEIVRHTLRWHKEGGDIDDLAEPPYPGARPGGSSRRAGGPPAR